MNLYFRSDKPKADGIIEVYHINRIQEVLGHEMCSQLMFIHAMTGSDTTSRIFGVGKKTAFQYLAKGEPVLRSCVIAFTIPNHTTELIDNLGCQAMAVLFGGNGTDSLETMRCNIFSQKVVSASSFVSQNVCPQPNLLPNFIPGHGLGRKRGGYGSQELGVEPARQSARPSYVNDECCSRQYVIRYKKRFISNLTVGFHIQSYIHITIDCVKVKYKLKKRRWVTIR